ncbi:unnamed protein product, partial [Prorocentrum cordatum]
PFRFVQESGAAPLRFRGPRRGCGAGMSWAASRFLSGDRTAESPTRKRGFTVFGGRHGRSTEMPADDRSPSEKSMVNSNSLVRESHALHARPVVAPVVRFQVWLQSRILGHSMGHWILLLSSGFTLWLCGSIAWYFSGGNGDYRASGWESGVISYFLFIDPGTQTGIDAYDPLQVQTVAVTVSVLGFVWNLTVMGTLVELIRETLKRYKRVYRHLHLSGHLLVLGWNDKTFFLLNELLSAERDAGFHGTRSGLCGRRRRRLQIVLVAPRPEVEMAQEVRMYFHGTSKDTRCIHFWDGDPTDRIELMKVSTSQAENILVMGSDRRGADQEVIRTLLALAALPGGPPKGQVFGEIRHPEKMSVIGTLLPTAEAIVTRTEVNRVLVLRALVPSVGFCMKEMATFTEGTNELYLRPVPAELVGWNFFDAAQLFTRSVVCGVKAGGGPPRLMPEARTELQEGDQLITLARTQDDADIWQHDVTREGSKPLPLHADGEVRRTEQKHLTVGSSVSTSDILQEDGQVKLGPSVEGPKIVLVIGCPHDFPNFLQIVDCYLAAGSTVHLLSMRDMRWRDATLKAYMGDAGVSVETGFGLERVEVHHYVGDSTRKGDLARLPLAQASCAIILADRADGEDPIDADTRTLTTAIALKALLGELRDRKRKCKIATEILDAETEKVISINSSVRKTGSFMYTRSIEAGLLAMAVAQKTSFTVVKQLLERRSAAGYIVAVPVGRHITGSETLSFLDLRERLWRSCRGILLGWRRQRDRYPSLNPPDKAELLDWEDGSGDELIVMRRSDVMRTSERRLSAALEDTDWDQPGECSSCTPVGFGSEEYELAPLTFEGEAAACSGRRPSKLGGAAAVTPVLTPTGTKGRASNSSKGSAGSRRPSGDVPGAELPGLQPGMLVTPPA